MKKFTNWLLMIGFLTVLFAVPIVGAVQPDAIVTKTENRSLRQAPDMEHPTLSYLAPALRDYVVDQFPFREELLGIYSRLQLAMGKNRVRGLYVTDDAWLMSQQYARVDWQLPRYTDALTELARTHPQTHFVYAMVPFKTGALYRLAPDYISNWVGEDNRAQTLQAMRGVNNLQLIDLVSYFEQAYIPEELKNLYFPTDFHWNAAGALDAMEYIRAQLESSGTLDSASSAVTQDVALEWLPRTYNGDLNRQLSYALPSETQVPVCVLKNTQDVRYYMSVDNSKQVPREKIVGAGKDKDIVTYSDLYTENLGYYRVVNPHARVKQRVLLLKDSFQDPTTDYFTALFSEVEIIDPRYYQEQAQFEDFLREGKPDLVLFLYHQNNFSSELVRFIEGKPIHPKGESS